MITRHGTLRASRLGGTTPVNLLLWKRREREKKKKERKKRKNVEGVRLPSRNHRHCNNAAPRAPVLSTFPPFPTFSTLGKPVGSAVFFAVAVNTQPPTRSFALFSRDNVRSRQRQPRTRQDRTISFRFIKIPSVPWPELAPAVRHRSPVDVSSMHARSRGSTVAFHESRDRC